ncbi:hypothetical protein RYO59_001296 [Thermosynechococcaceae cyanobacterium Okahandja]
MVDYQERRDLIRKSLKIQPISHGQVHTCTVGFQAQPQISQGRYEELRSSLENHGSNLIPIVVRRSESLGDDKEYEVIYGADWVKVAEDIGIEMLWAWVFDLSDTEVAATCEELSRLLEVPIIDPMDQTGNAAPPPTAPTGEMGASAVTAVQEIVAALERFVKVLSDTVNQGAEITIKIQSKSQIDQERQLQLKREALQSRYKLMTATQLKNQAKEFGMSFSGNAKKDDLITALVAHELSV